MKRILLSLVLLSVPALAQEETPPADSPEALWKKGVQLRDGEGVPRDDEAAVRCFQQAAEAGHAAAIRDLAMMEDACRGGLAYDGFHVFDLLSNAADKGDAEATYLCGERLRWGIGVPQDESRGMELVRKAAKAGVWEAAEAVAFDENEKGADEERMKKLWKNAARLAHAAAKEGDTSAMFSLGDRYAAGDGVPMDYGNFYVGKSTYWVRKGLEVLGKKAAAGDPKAQYDLGMFALYPHGGGDFDSSSAEARIWFRKSAEAGYVPAMLELAEILLDPEGTVLRVHENFDFGPATEPPEEDLAEARSWFEKAAEKGSPDAFAAFGVLLARGRGVPQDKKTAAALFEAAASFGVKSAMANRGILFEEAGSFADAATWYRQAVRFGDEEGMLRLGSMLLSGRDGIAADPEVGFALLLKIAKNGHEDAIPAVADALEKGLGCEKDPIAAAHWLMLYADNGTDSGSDPGLIGLTGQSFFLVRTRNATWYLGETGGFTKESRAAAAKKARSLLEGRVGDEGSAIRSRLDEIDKWLEPSDGSSIRFN